MFKYVLKRLLMLIPVLIGISILIFFILDFSPGDPARLILGQGASQQAVDALHTKLGLDRPFFVRYFEYILNAVQGDLGTSWRNSASISQELALRIQPTLTIAVFGIALSIIIGIPLGIISAVRQYSVMDVSGQILSVILSAMPGFLVAMVLSLFFALRLSWLPATFPPVGVSFKHYILPSVAVAASALAGIMRMTRSSMLEVIRQDYVRTAKAKGASRSQVILKHSLRNALLPVITQIGMLIVGTIGGAVIVEQVFAIPGMGIYILAAVRSKDVPAVMGSVLLIAVIAGVMNLIVDVLYAYIDPRIKSQYAKNPR